MAFSNITLNKALSRHQAGQLGQARKLYKRILKYEPENPDALHLLGRLEQEIGQPKRAEQLINKALKSLPEYPLFLNSLGDVYVSQQRLDEAKSVLNRAIARQEDYIDAYNSLGFIYKEEGDLEEAVATFKKALTINPNFVKSLSGMGQVLYLLGDSATAATYFAKVLAIAPDSADANYYFGLVQVEIGDLNVALAHLRVSIELVPNDPIYTSGIINVLKGVKFIAPDPWFESFLVACLGKSELSHSGVAPAAASMLLIKPAFQDALAALPLKSSHLTSLSADALFLKLLQTNVIPNLEFEDLVTKLRLVLNQQLNTEHIPLMAALAEYAFNTDYVLFQSSEDLAIEARLLQNDVETLTEVELLALTSYRALIDVPNASGLLKHAFASQRIEHVIKRTLQEPLAEREIQTHIVSLTPINDKVSLEVQNQYEFHPYPRWLNIQSFQPQKLVTKIELESPVFTDPGWPEVPNVLVAGCGTGRQPISHVSLHPNTDVLAVDLSRTSLAYGIRKSAELKIDNIRFCQADLLNLDGLTDRFEFIDCAGVLHHLEDPLAGWKAINKLLRPGGVMRIGLYSEAARKLVVLAREKIAELKIQPTPDNIRKFRQQIKTDPELAMLRNLSACVDYFSMGDIRDLIFHVRENRFDIPMIKNYLQQLNLEFGGFIFRDRKIIRSFRQVNPKTSHWLDLDRWAEFEEENPDTFRRMYVFYCLKR